MARNHFLELPLELRFKVYYELAMACLNDNRSSGLSGLFLACHQTHQEVRDEYASKVIPMFKILNLWETLSSYMERFRLEWAFDGNALGSIYISSITVSTDALVLDQSNVFDYANHEKRIRCLRSAFRFANHTLTIHLKRGGWHMYPSSMDLIKMLSILPDGKHAFGRVTRLIFQGESYLGHAVKMSNTLRDEMQKTHLSIPETTSPFREICHAWVARFQVARGSWATWLVGFDFEEELPEVEGVVVRDGVYVSVAEEDSHA
ncbi:hypothetical protein FB567DRAFT_595514 [Paraphoma chrysanthemicola]|uniref:Uncharacterized protein n=1 Tax=Paraphoma chrysanthemicola TaxID=798071 RepID=A0A8K0VVX3_9PLEO|nr:hypothetical protein FB567DRAFT_595514 [Paraphoma chrysanthemicola]